MLVILLLSNTDDVPYKKGHLRLCKQLPNCESGPLTMASFLQTHEISKQLWVLYSQKPAVFSALLQYSGHLSYHDREAQFHTKVIEQNRRIGSCLDFVPEKLLPTAVTSAA